MRGEEIRRRLHAAGKSDADLRGRLGWSSSRLSRIMTGDRKRLSTDELEQIEQALAELEGKPAPRLANLIPLLGYAAGEGDRFAWTPDKPLEWVEAPPLQTPGVETVAVRVPGELMAPRLFPGETVFVGLGLSPARGGDVVVELADGTAMVRTYAGRKDGRVFLQHYNPEATDSVAEIQVKGLHAVTCRR